MKTRKMVLMAVLCALTFSGGGCSRSDDADNSQAKPVAATPVPNLKLDAERLRDATMKAAEARRREDAAAAAKRGVTPTPAQTTPMP